MTPKSNDTHVCPICLEPFKPDDMCATDITEGVCHASCLEGSPIVNLDTGEPSGGPASIYRYDEARIHRDGGHYEADHGTGKAVEDADHIVANLYARAERAERQLAERDAALREIKQSANRRVLDTEMARGFLDDIDRIARAALGSGSGGWPVPSGLGPYAPCGGCGNADPDKRCLGCLHPFVPTLPASPSTAGER